MNVGTEALVLLSTRGKFNKKIGCYELNKKKTLLIDLNSVCSV